MPHYGLDKDIMGHVIPVDHCRLWTVHTRWSWPDRYADAVERHWEAARVEKPAYFDGPVFVLGAHRICDGTLEGELLAARFRHYIYWRAHGFPEAGVRDGFGSGIIISADGHVVLGRQRAGNVNAGLAYLPGGFIDPKDIAADGRVDIEASVAREIAEETGLGPDELRREPGYLVVTAGPVISIGCVLRAALTSGEIADRITAHIGRQSEPELAEPVVVTGPLFDREHVPPYTRVLLDWLWDNDIAQARSTFTPR